MSLLPPDPVFCLKSDMGHIHSMCFPKINENYTSQLLAATEKGTIYFWDLETNRLQHKQDMGESIQAIHSRQYDVITQEKSGSVKFWSIENNTGYKVTKSYECYGGYCKSVILQQQILLPKEKSRIDVVDVNTFEKTKEFVPEDDRLGNVICLETVESGEDMYVLVGYERGDIIMFDYNTSKQCSHLKLKEYITSLTFDPTTRRGVCGNSSNTLQIFTIDKSLKMALKCELTLTNEGCSVVKLRPDNRLFVSGGWDGRLRLYSWKTLRVLVVLAEHKKMITDVQFSHSVVRYWNSKILAASGGDGVISLWSLYNNYN